MRLLWDQTGERKYETGVNHGVLWVQNGGSYGSGVVWNGFTGVTESPSGAEANDMWADNMKYGSIRSAETYSSTIECYTYPKEFKKCNGEDELIPGVSLGQQKRSSFAFSYRTEVGTDSNSEEGYKIHIIYGATASPSESAYTTINDSPEAITFSYEVDTTPIDVPGFKPTASLEIDTTKLTKYHKDLGLLQELEDYIYGTDEEDSKLIYPNEAADILGINILDENNVEFTYSSSDSTAINGMILPDLTGKKNNILIIPEGTTKILKNAGKYKVADVNLIQLPSTLTNIDNNAFNNCLSLASLTIPDSVTSIGDYAFDSCNSLASLNLGNSVTSIGDNTFRYCYALTSLSIPDSVMIIGNQTFCDCNSLASLNLGNVTSIGNSAFLRCYTLTSLSIPDSVTIIGDQAFSGCNALASLNLGNVAAIGNSAFASCRALTTLTIPDSVAYIGDSAFNDCNSLTSLTIPDSVTSIGENAFNGCNSLTSLTIPDSVTSIGENAFNGCNRLTDIYFTGTQAEWEAIDGISNAGFNGTETIHYEYVPEAE